MRTRIFLISDKEIYLTESIYETAFCEEETLKNICEKVRLDASVHIAGIERAGRYIARYDYPLTEGYINELMENYDMILPIAGKVREDNIFIQYMKNTSDNNNDLAVLRSVLEEILSSNKDTDSDNMVSAFDFVCRGKLISAYDQFIAKRDIFIEVMLWIQETVTRFMIKRDRYNHSEKCCDKIDINFIKDILFRVWITSHNPGLKIKEENVIVKNPDVFKNFVDRTQLIYKYVNIIEQDLISARKLDNFSTSIIDEKECDDDFEGRIPVWICWWQGFDNIPEIVNACVNSIKRNMPPNKTVIRFITLENVGRYVTFTADIINKFNEEKVSFTHLAEALRAELLYRYGGLWIDATYYISKPVDESFFDQEFFTVAFDRPLFGPDMSEARWSTSLWYAKPHNKLMQFITEEIWIYWEKEDKVVDYFIMDYETAIPYNEFPEIKAMIDNCPKCNPAVYDLQLMLNCRCTETILQEMKERSTFYKLNRRLEYLKETKSGFRTLFGYIYNQDTDGDKANEKNEITPLKIDVNGKTGDEVLEAIRQYNPLRILDKADFFSEPGNVARYTMADMFWNHVVIDCIDDKTVLHAVHREIYDHIIKNPNDIDESIYDLILI